MCQTKVRLFTLNGAFVLLTLAGDPTPLTLGVLVRDVHTYFDRYRVLIFPWQRVAITRSYKSISIMVHILLEISARSLGLTTQSRRGKMEGLSDG